MLYCGYQGVGKSTYCRQNPTATIDLDSSNFKKYEHWEEDYIKMALSLASDNKIVFISAHRVVIEYLIENNIDFKVLIPNEKKEVWRNRLEFRYNKVQSVANLKALYDFDLHFEEDMKYYAELEKRGIEVCKVKARIMTTISDFI